MKWMKLR